MSTVECGHRQVLLHIPRSHGRSGQCISLSHLQRHSISLLCITLSCPWCLQDLPTTWIFMSSVSHHYNVYWWFSSVLWHCWLGDRKVIRPVKSWVLVCWWWQFDPSFAHLIASVVTATSIILTPIKSKMETFWNQANLGSPGKMVVKPERECMYTDGWHLL